MYVGIYASHVWDAAQRNPRANFRFALARRKEDLPVPRTSSEAHRRASYWPDETLKIKKVPAWFADVLEKEFAPGKSVQKLGYITYEGRGRLAITNPYYPRGDLPGKIAGGLAYFLEALSTREMKRLGVHKIRTSSEAEPSRTRMVYGVGLLPGLETPIDEWLLGMGRGMRMTSPAAAATQRQIRLLGLTFRDRELENKRQRTAP